MKNRFRPRLSILPVVALVLFASSGLAFLQQKPTAISMRESADVFLKTLTPEQRVITVMPYDQPERLQWHFIPKDKRKGLMIGTMTDEQKETSMSLLRSALSQTGYDKARNVMELEKVLNAFQGEGAGPIRDHQRYYFSIFGDPTGADKWGFSFEGHHLSMNFVFEGDKVVSHSPIFYAANPATVKTDKVASVAEGMQVLADEESIAFEIVNSLSDEQRKTAVVAEKAPREIRGAGEPQPPRDEPAGIRVSQLNADQQQKVISLIESYVKNLPDDVSSESMKSISDGGMDDVYFAWAGATKPGVGHYYLLEGPSFQIEFVNTQPDAMGNPASHIHCVLRNPQGDFGIPIK